MTDADTDQKPLDWSKLSEDEQRVMRGAIDAQSLEALWAIYLPEAETFVPNRGYKYVPQLARATYRLIVNGDVQISFRDRLDDPYIDLSIPEAISAIGIMDNWWTYDPTEVTHDAQESDGNPVVGGAAEVDGSHYFVSQTNRTRPIVNYVEPSPMSILPTPTRRPTVAIALEEN
jgi:hypothetical protein